MALLNFDSTNVPTATPFEPLPAGFYKVIINGSEEKPTKDGRGAYLELKLQVIEGPHAKRVLYDRLNLKNENAKAVSIAQETLSAICHATGVIRVQDSKELHGIPIEVKVAFKPAEGKYEAGNEIKGYRKVEGGAVPAFAASAPAAAPAVGAATPPWA